MSENYIHIDNITEDRAARPGDIGIGAKVRTDLDGVSKFALVSVLSLLLNDLEIEPMDIIAYRAYRQFIEENIVRSDRTRMALAEVKKSLERFRRIKAEMEGDA